jgi:phage shock protein PspC (stress-responsive transcriptional regulator)
MKKNISINISGIIFHIEEDGYDTLKKYLDSINKYFSTFEDSSEILADIESRIAEIFLSKLNEEKQIITADDVNALVATMGSVSDFKAAEDQDSATEKASASSGETSSDRTGSGEYVPPRTFTPSKQLMRDQKRKILGGVCAGLANYFNIDALWVRLFFAVLFFAWGITLFAYIIMWIIVPGSYDLEEPNTGKKMFRDPERKIIGGVSGGVAAFIGIDVIAVRVLFILFTFAAGIGLFIYIVLWLILPEARTLTDRVQMQGEPVTLSNIESTIKKSQTENPAEEESTLTKVLLFPFRLLGMILSGVGKILVPILEIIRVGIGIVIILIGICFVFAIVVSSGVLFGIFSAATFSLPWMMEMSEASVPFDTILAAFPAWTMIAAFIGTIVPSIFMILLGASVIAKRIVFSAAAGWTLFVLFFISMALLAVGIPKIVFSFKEKGEYRVENSYKLKGKTAVLRINEVGMDDYDVTRLSLKGYESTDFKLVQTFKSQGTTRARAIENARMVDYTVAIEDSVFTFDSNVKFKPDAIFRAQRLDMTLYIPYNFPFIMDEGISRFITEYVDCCGMAGTNTIDQYTWKITEERGLECINCPMADEEEEQGRLLRDFDEVEVSGKFDVKISQGHDYSVELIGPDREKEKYNIYRSGETLVIEYQGKRNFNWNARDLNIEDMRINIVMPSLEKLEATGFGTIRFEDFGGNDMDIESHGPIRIRGDLRTQNLSINLTGKSEADLSGSATSLNARLELASKLRAYNLDVVDAMVEVSGASFAKVNVSGTLEIEEGVASSVDYRGNPSVVKRD